MTKQEILENFVSKLKKEIKFREEISYKRSIQISTLNNLIKDMEKELQEEEKKMEEYYESQRSKRIHQPYRCG